MKSIYSKFSKTLIRDCSLCGFITEDYPKYELHMREKHNVVFDHRSQIYNKEGKWMGIRE